MSKKLTYSEAGVDRETRAKSKQALSMLKQTYTLGRYGKVVQLPYGNIFLAGDRYLDLVIEGVEPKFSWRSWHTSMTPLEWTGLPWQSTM